MVKFRIKILHFWLTLTIFRRLTFYKLSGNNKLDRFRLSAHATFHIQLASAACRTVPLPNSSHCFWLLLTVRISYLYPLGISSIMDIYRRNPVRLKVVWQRGSNVDTKKDDKKCQNSYWIATAVLCYDNVGNCVTDRANLGEEVRMGELPIVVEIGKDGSSAQFRSFPIRSHNRVSWEAYCWNSTSLTTIPTFVTLSLTHFLFFLYQFYNTHLNFLSVLFCFLKVTIWSKKTASLFSLSSWRGWP